MTRKGRSITLSLEENDKAQLEAIALEFGMKWGDEPNISRLIKAIAQRRLLILSNTDWSRDRINALNRARIALIDAGQTDEAIAVAQLLVERSELIIPLRRELEQFISQPATPWRVEVNRYIRQNQPFQLSYQDAAQRIFRFTVYYAKITPHEKRQYLDCWCEETVGNRDIAELRHNWCLRLDRITDAAIAPVPGKWRQLAQIEVELYFFNNLAFAYTPKPEDISNEWLINPPQTRRVVRQISNSFWFIREIMRYGSDCKVISPDSIRDRIRQQVQQMVTLYED